ncbi:hypothetical protein IKQ21_01085 [bacterium]|nr:hypothetical protein [bacterium]
MNIALRKLVMLDKEFTKREEAAKLEGFSSCPFDPIFREKVSKVVDQIRYI